MSDDAGAGFVRRSVGPVLLVASAVGLASAFALAVEKVKLLRDPTYTPVCSFDGVLSCAAVMTSEQSEAFGFPNPLLGIAGFAATAAFGLVITSGGSLPVMAWRVLQLGLTFAVGFVHWLFFQSTYEIEAVCPFCAVVWAATIVAFVYVTLDNVAASRLGLPASARRVGEELSRYHSLAAITWIAILGGLVGFAFRDHWSSL